MAQAYTNEPYLQRRTKIGTYTNLAGLGILLLGFVASLNDKSELVIPVGDPPLRIGFIWLAYVSLIVGFGLAAYGGRFLVYARLEPEKKLATALKGLDKQYRLYNYALPAAPFLLLAPHALYVLHVKTQDGPVFVKGERWSQPFSFLRFIRFFSTEQLGQPERELATAKEKATAWLQENLPDAKIPVDGYIVFLHPKAQLMVEGANPPLVLLNANPDALKEALRRDKKPPLPPALYKRVADALKNETHGQATDE